MTDTNFLDTPNMKFWNKVSITDPKYAKPYSGKGGFKGTSIAAHYQVRNATAILGMFGREDTWGIRNEKFDMVQISAEPKDVLLVYSAELFYNYEDKKGIVPLDSSIEVWSWNENSKSYHKTSDVHKKVKTDALTKGLSYLGFNADIFMNDFSSSKYSNDGGEGDGGSRGGATGSAGGKSGDRPAIPKDGWLTDEQYNSAMNETDPKVILKMIDDYSVEGKGIAGKFRKSMLGRVKYLEQK